MRSSFFPLFVTQASGQKLSVGIVAGASLTGDFQNGSYFFPGGTLPDGRQSSTTIVVSPLSRGLIIGPNLELSLPRGLSVEVDALHREMRSKTTDNVSPPVQFLDGHTISALGPFEQTHTSWEIPVLMKYKLPGSFLE